MSKYERVALEQGTEKWLEWRKTVASASEAPAVVCASPFEPKTPYGLWRLSQGKLKIFNSAAIRKGNQHEDHARQLVNKRLGSNFVPDCGQRDLGSFILGASFDGVDSDAILEIKCVGSKSPTWKKAAKQDQGHYIYQLAHQARTIDAKVAYFAVYNYEKDDLRLFEVPISKLREVWKNELLPAWTKYFSDIKEMGHPELGEGDRVDMSESEEWRKLRAECEPLQNCITQVKNSLKELEDLLKSKHALLEELSGGMSAEGNGLSFVKVKRKGSIDYSKIPELKGIDTDQYRKADTEYWKLTITETENDKLEEDFEAI